MSILKKAGALAALSTAMGAAHALPLADYDAAVVNIFYGGATATDNVLENIWIANVGGLCVAGTIDSYRSVAADNERVIFCRVDSSTVPGFPAAPGLKVAFHKESRGGSSNGVNPLIDVASSQGHALRWLDMTALRNSGGAGCGNVAVGATATLQAYTNHPNCQTFLTPVDTAASATFDVHGGISDTEPALSSPPPSAAEIALLSTKPGLGIQFGVPVTEVLYRALQVGQGITLKPECDTVAEQDSQACVPSLTRSQIRGLYSGRIVNWTRLRDRLGNALPSAPGVTPPANNTVHHCRRVASSGTQASVETYWLAQRCESGSPTFVLPNDGSSVNDTVWVPANVANGTRNAGPSSGNVRTCLNTYNTANRWGIGVLSTEVTAAQMVGFRMVAVDGAAPSLENVANGDYEFFTENTLNRIADGGTGALAATDPRRIAIEYIENNLGQPAILAEVNAPFAGRPWGDGGVLAIAGAFVPNAPLATKANMASNPVNTLSRSTGGTTNNCNPPIAIRDTPANGSPNP
jgi:ABC-type phosphate transport system substrate-binding protein